jgi:hypothetical protein
MQKILSHVGYTILQVYWLAHMPKSPKKSKKSQIFTLYPEDLKWQPRFVKVDFIRMQKALSHVGFPDTRSTLACISDVTG